MQRHVAKETKILSERIDYMAANDKKAIIKELTDLGKSKGNLTNDEIIEAIVKFREGK